MSLRSNNKIKVEGAMSSMTDLVFLLLIFFIILSTMAKPALEIEPPKASAGSDTEPTKTIVTVKADNTMTIEGNDKKRITIQPEELSGVLLDYVDEDKIVELAADQSADWQYAVQVMDAVKQNKLKLHITTKQ